MQSSNFNPHNDFGYRPLDGIEITMREWFIKGQRAFREACRFGDPGSLEDYQYLLDSCESGIELDGFMMGWNADEWAYRHDLQQSVLGGVHASEERTGLIEGDERGEVLAGSDRV